MSCNIPFLDNLAEILATALTILKNYECQLFGFTYAGEDQIRFYCVRSLKVLSPGGHYKAVSIKNIYEHSKGWGALFDFAQKLSLSFTPKTHGENLSFND